MKMEDMVIISVDDHIVDPGDVFDSLKGTPYYETAPKLKKSPGGANFWEYQGMRMASVALNAVVGRPREEYGMEPTALEQLRKGTYDVHARVDDMNVNGVAASLNFSSIAGLDGMMYVSTPDKAHVLQHLQAHNDWLIDFWCGSYPARFIKNGLVPAWDIDATVAEVKRLVAKGCHAIMFNENPTARGLPSAHDEYWEPLWKVCADNEVTINLHIGGGNPAPHATALSPIEAWITTMPMSVAVGAADWMHLSALHRYPTLKIALSESGIGWVPYLMERADYTHFQHQAWTHSKTYLGEMLPSEVFKRHFSSCFIDDDYGLANLDRIGEDNVCYEVDYPHSDAPWPNAPETLWRSAKKLSDAQIDKISHLNAMRLYKHDMFSIQPKAELTVGALRARAAADGVDTSLHSGGGAAPLAPGETYRAVTSGDINAMFAKQSEAA